MSISFKKYKERDKIACLSLFDDNCPKYFAANEKIDYKSFLDKITDDYLVCDYAGKIAGAFGLFKLNSKECRLHWILLSPKFQNIGIGSSIMLYCIELALAQHTKAIHIATSQVAFKFFEKHEALVTKKTLNGFGPGMDKIDMIISL